MSGAWRTALALALALAPAAAGAARAEDPEVEAVGVAAAAPEVTARQRALAAGVGDAVLRVADALAREAGGASDPAALASALGGDPASFALRSRVVEDRGERAVQLLQEPGADREYVVLVAVEVDRERVRARLRQAGLFGAAPAAGGGRIVALTFEGIDSYASWERLRAALAASEGAVRPVEFARRVVMAELTTRESNDALVERLRRAVGDSLGIAVAASDPASLRIEVISPAPPPQGEGAPPAAAPGTR